jgi:hypothetical protein
MYLQEILEVAIGLVFVWLVLSIATMSLQEWIGNIVNLRAKDLEKAISQMLNSRELTNRFYNYPLIANLYPRPKRPGKKTRLPSYIPANKFGATLFDLIIQAGTDYSPIQAIAGEIEIQLSTIESPEQQKLAREDWNAILETTRKVADSGFATSAFDSLKFQIQACKEKHPELQPALDELAPRIEEYYGKFVEEQRNTSETGLDTGLAMRQFRLGMLAIEKVNPRLVESVTAIIKQAEDYALRGESAVAATRVNLESWFNDAMDRLSGSYKRRAQFIAFLIGFILALVLNVDSINVATSLWREPTLRQAIIAQAQDYSTAAACNPAATPGNPAAGPLENIPALQAQLQALNIPFGWAIIQQKTGVNQCSLLPINPGQVSGIPVWTITSLVTHGAPICYAVSNFPTEPNGWLVKILGMLITGAAAAQGAPFWFDILKKIINVRGTGANPVEQKPVG